VGYAVFPALRLALREQNAAGSIGNYYVELVAYNDNADPTFAARVAHNVAQDESVVAVIGHLLPLTTNAALPVYAKAGLSVLSMEGTTASCDAKTYVFRGPINPTPPEQARAETAMQRFAEVSGGPPAGASSAAAYTATRRVLAAIQKTSTQPTRANVGKTLGALLGCW
jgi:ABC-type branched-subunit amino acid transport system substrate-binding protein